MMKMNSFVSGMATGAIAGAVASMLASGAMHTPQMRHGVQKATEKAEDMAHRFFE